MLVPAVPAEMVRVEIQLPGSRSSPAQTTAEPVYEHRRRHTPCSGLRCTELELLLPASCRMGQLDTATKTRVVWRQTFTDPVCSGHNEGGSQGVLFYTVQAVVCSRGGVASLGGHPKERRIIILLTVGGAFLLSR